MPLPHTMDPKTDMHPPITPPMTPEARRTLVESIFDKARARGETIEDHPEFLSSVEEWIAGEIDMAELREKYRQFLLERHSARKGKEKADPNDRPSQEIDVSALEIE